MNSITSSLPLGIDRRNRRVESIASLVKYCVTPSHEKNAGTRWSSEDARRPSASDLCSKSWQKFHVRRDPYSASSQVFALDVLTLRMVNFKDAKFCSPA